MKKNILNSLKQYFDPLFLFTSIFIITFGLLMLFSASTEIAYTNFNDPFYYIKKQIFFLIISFIFCISISHIRLSNIRKYSLILFIGSIIILLLLFIPELGKEVKGSRRWLKLYLFTIQPSELVKLTFLVWLCSFLSLQNEKIKKFEYYIIPFLYLLIPCTTILYFKDLGSIVIILFITLSLLWLANAKFFHILSTSFFGIFLIYVLIVFEPYRMKRMMTFLDPFADELDGGYQLSNSLTAIGDGGIFGKGLGGSSFKQFYLPEAHTDFIFAIIAEELGLFGSILMIFLFSILIYKCFNLGGKALKLNLKFQGYLSYGIGLYFGFQSLLHMYVNVGMSPTKGLTLPFFSAGGSSYIVSFISIYFVFKIYREVYLATINTKF